MAGVATAEQAAADDEVGRQSVYVFKLLEGLGVPVVGFEACEAEDVIGTLAEREAARPGTRVAVVSGDRDLYQLVRDPDVYVLYPIKGVSEMLRVDEAEVDPPLQDPRPGLRRLRRPPGRSVGRAARREGHRREDRGRRCSTPTATSTRSSQAAQANPGAGALSRVAAHLDYVERARQVVAIPRDLPLPDVDLDRPRGAAHPRGHRPGRRPRPRPARLGPPGSAAPGGRPGLAR